MTEGAAPILSSITPEARMSSRYADRPTTHERWRTEHDVSRVGAIEDKAWRMREFALLDPVNNLLRVGRSLR
jgi:hypothetical protein